MASCISSATGTLIFAIINIIVITLWFAFVLGLGFYLALMTNAVAASTDTRIVYAFSIIEIVAFIAVFFISFITLVFSSLLLDGILKKKAGHLKAYFIYGVIVVVLTLSTLVGNLASGNIRLMSTDFIPLFCVYAVYGSILYMIRHAYTKMETVADQYEPKPLLVQNEHC